MKPSEEVLFTIDAIRAVRFHPENVAAAQSFMEANHGYHLMATGEPARPGDAMRELTERPAPVRSEDLYFLGFFDGGDLRAIANVLRTWPVPGISHVGLFQVAEAWQGNGVAKAWYEGLEGWMIAAFSPRWLRLG